MSAIEDYIKSFPFNDYKYVCQNDDERIPYLNLYDYQREFLEKTDWVILRCLEENIPFPEEYVQQRKTARENMKFLQEYINERFNR